VESVVQATKAAKQSHSTATSVRGIIRGQAEASGVVVEKKEGSKGRSGRALTHLLLTRTTQWQPGLQHSAEGLGSRTEAGVRASATCCAQ